MSYIGGLLAGAAQGAATNWTARREELKVEAANSFKLATEQRKNDREDLKAAELARQAALEVKYVQMQLPGTQGEAQTIIVAVHKDGRLANNDYNLAPTLSKEAAQKKAIDMADAQANWFGGDAEDFKTTGGSRAQFIAETVDELMDSSSIYRMFGGKGGEQVKVGSKGPKSKGPKPKVNLDDGSYYTKAAEKLNKQGGDEKPNEQEGGSNNNETPNNLNNNVESIVTTASKQKEKDQDIRNRMSAWNFEVGLPPSLLESPTEQSMAEDTTSPEYYQDVRDRITAPLLEDTPSPSLLESATEQSMAEDTTAPLDTVKPTEKTSNYDDNGDHVVSQFVIGQENFSAEAYPDGSGWAIGYGTNNKNVKEGQTITKKEAYRLMQKDLKNAQDYVDELVNVPLTANQNKAIVSLMYNTGYRNIKESQALLALNAGDYEMFAELAFGDKGFIYSKINGVPEINKGLITRRNDERILFNDNKPVARPTPSNIPPNSPKEFEAAYFNL
jgi:GH24 family phage-related lysozyme (muramidase)